jgi:hypothetical protein
VPDAPRRRSKMEFRRRVPRQIAGWVVRCRIDDGPVDEARECRVLDISEFGVRILLHHPRGSELIGRHVSIEIPKRGASPNIRLEGEVRNAARADGGCVRLGIEFVGLSELEQSAVKALGVLSGAP